MLLNFKVILKDLNNDKTQQPNTIVEVSGLLEKNGSTGDGRHDSHLKHNNCVSDDYHDGHPQ